MRLSSNNTSVHFSFRQKDSKKCEAKKPMMARITMRMVILIDGKDDDDEEEVEETSSRKKRMLKMMIMSLLSR